jgi:sugar fermentation stimulation protein A
MAYGKTAGFPDSVSTRGTKHLHELISLSENGHSTEILYTVQREGADFFEPARDIDPDYTKTLKEAENAGVLISVYPVEMSTKKIRLNWADSLNYKI